MASTSVPATRRPAAHETPPAGRSTRRWVTTARRAVLAVLAGGALYVGHPPLDWGWVGLVALAPLIALARDVAAAARPLRVGAGWGFVAGVVFFGALLEWVRYVDWLGVVLLVGTQAAFIAAFVAGLAWWGRRRWPAWSVVAVLWWVGLEAVRGAAPFGGFAWGILGYTQHDGPFLLVARSLSVLGVSLVLAGLAAAAEALLQRLARGGPLVQPLAAGAAVAAAGLALTLVPPPGPTGESVDIAAVQGFDIEGSTGRSLPRAVRIAEGHVDLTRELADGPAPDLLLWPENALDAEPSAVPELEAAIAEARAAVDGAPLVTGMITAGPTADTWANTMAVFDDGPTAPRDVYVKRQPVPFGEYIPFRPLVDWYPPVNRMRPTDAVAGTEPAVLDAGLDGVRVGAVICFESVFPRLVHSQVREGANVLVVGTNNSTFGRTGMSDQHLAFSSLRAVETGRWIVHAALTGKSGIVAPDGSVTQETGVYEQALLRADVPLVEGRTLATAVGDGVGWAALALTVAGLGAAGWRTRRRAAAMPRGYAAGEPSASSSAGPAPVI
jgi:apolipoprotein N-acyltransferase